MSPSRTPIPSLERYGPGPAIGGLHGASVTGAGPSIRVSKTPHRSRHRSAAREPGATLVRSYPRTEYFMIGSLATAALPAPLPFRIPSTQERAAHLNPRDIDGGSQLDAIVLLQVVFRLR